MYKITQENYIMLNRERIYTGRFKIYVQDPIVMKKGDDNKSKKF